MATKQNTSNGSKLDNAPKSDFLERKTGALWVKEGDDNKKYLSLQVEIGGVKYNLLGYENKFYKENPESNPRYQLYFSKLTYDTLVKPKGSVSNVKSTTPISKPAEAVPADSENEDSPF